MPLPLHLPGSPSELSAEVAPAHCRRRFIGTLAAAAFTGSTLALTYGLRSLASRRDALLRFSEVAPALTNIKLTTEILASSFKHFTQRFRVLSSDDRLAQVSQFYKMGIKLRDVCNEVGEALAPNRAKITTATPPDADLGLGELLGLYAQQLAVLNRTITLMVNTRSLHSSQSANAQCADTLRTIGNQLAVYGRAIRDACSDLDDNGSLAVFQNTQTEPKLRGPA